jgi:hypothetical protein
MRSLAFALLACGALATLAAPFLHGIYEWHKLFTALAGLALVGAGVGVAVLTPRRRATRRATRPDSA